MLIGMIVARIGCCLNGCCAGRSTRSWLGLTLPDHRGVWKRRVPTQMLEAAWGAAVLAGAVAMWPHRPFNGAVFLCVVAAYAAGRLVLESTREERDHISGFALHQLLSTAFVATSVAALALAWAT